MEALELRENARFHLQQIRSIETGIDYLNKVKAIEVWAKAEKKDAELQNLIAEQKIRTQRILGNLLIEQPVVKHRPKEGSQDVTLNSYGISKNESSTFQKIASLPDEVFEQEIATAKEESEKRIELTTSRVLKAAKTFEQERKKQEAQISSRDQSIIERLKKGETVVVNQKTDLAAIKWAEDNGLYVRCDRFSDWGNPYEMGKDGNREEVCDNYKDHYIQFKPSLLKKIHTLSGKALGCWCAPEKCHCDTLKSLTQTVVRHD